MPDKPKLTGSYIWEGRKTNVYAYPEDGSGHTISVTSGHIPPNTSPSFSVKHIWEGALESKADYFECWKVIARAGLAGRWGSRWDKLRMRVRAYRAKIGEENG